MKEKGIVRNIDPLGRLVIPKEVRKELGFALGEPVEIIPEKGCVIIRKYEHCCIICGNSITNLNETIIINQKKVCKECQEKISLNNPEKK